MLPQPTAYTENVIWGRQICLRGLFLCFSSGPIDFSYTIIWMLNYSNKCKFHVNFDAKIKLQVMHDFVKLISISSAGVRLEKVVGGLRRSAAA